MTFLAVTRARRLAPIVALTWLMALGFPGTSEAGEELKICNESDRLVSVAAFAVVRYAFESPQGEMSAWYNIRPGYCQRVYFLVQDYSHATVNVGIVRDGIGPIRYSFRIDDSSLTDRIDSFCVHPTEGNWAATVSDALRRVSPPCGSESWELETSASVKVGSGWDNLVLNITSNGEPTSPGSREAPDSPSEERCTKQVTTYTTGTGGVLAQRTARTCEK